MKKTDSPFSRFCEKEPKMLGISLNEAGNQLPTPRNVAEERSPQLYTAAEAWNLANI
jgi:hypothetical protein